MFNSIISFFLLKVVNSLYKEIEGVNSLYSSLEVTTLELESKIYYRLEIFSEFYLVYFDNSLLNHENPFILFVLLPITQSEGWHSPNEDKLFADAFDNFHKLSAFISLIPNTQNRDSYSFSVSIGQTRLYGQVKLGEKPIFKTQTFLSKKLDNSNVLLKSTRIGTIGWSSFYKTNINHYGLFMKMYYIVYSNPTASFRAGGLGKLVFITFKTKFKNNKVLLSDNFKICSIQNLNPREKNKYRLYGFLPGSNIDVDFDLKENNSLQFDVSVGNLLLQKETEMIAFEKLPRVGVKVYSFEEDIQENLTVEIPIYSFEEKLELSKLVISLKFVSEKIEDSPKVQTKFQVYDFTKENSFWLYLVKAYHIYLEHFVENGNIIFKVSKVNSLKPDVNPFIPKEIKQTIDTVDEKNVSTFINGAVICDQDFAVKLTKIEPYIEEQQIKSNGETSLQRSDKKTKNKAIYWLIGFVFVLISLFVFTSKKQFSKRRRFNRSN